MIAPNTSLGTLVAVSSVDLSVPEGFMVCILFGLGQFRFRVGVS